MLINVNAYKNILYYYGKGNKSNDGGFLKK